MSLSVLAELGVLTIVAKRDRLDDMDWDLRRREECLQVGCVAGTRRAEPKIGADDDRRRTQSIEQKLGRESAGVEF